MPQPEDSTPWRSSFHSVPFSFIYGWWISNSMSAHTWGAREHLKMIKLITADQAHPKSWHTSESQNRTSASQKDYFHFQTRWKQSVGHYQRSELWDGGHGLAVKARAEQRHSPAVLGCHKYQQLLLLCWIIRNYFCSKVSIFIKPDPQNTNQLPPNDQNKLS